MELCIFIIAFLQINNCNRNTWLFDISSSVGFFVELLYIMFYIRIYLNAAVTVWMDSWRKLKSLNLLYINI